MAEESATLGAATFIFLLALFFIAYLLLLPQTAREDVLKNREIDFDGFNGNKEKDRDGKEKETLLLRNPGAVLPPDKDEITKEFASANLFVTSEKETSTIANNIVVSSGFFKDTFRDVEFTIDTIDEIKQLKLFFNIVDSRGVLVMHLNGNIIFEGSATINDLPIEIPVQNLRQRNILRFAPGKTGFVFGSSKYILKDIKLVKELRLEHRSEVRQFEVARAEAVKDATLKFFVNCLEISRDQGILKVFLNRKNIFFGQIVCDASQTNFDVDPDDFKDGTNFLTFEVDKGDYIIEQMKLEYSFDEGFNPLYFFTVDEEQFDDIKDKDKKVILKMKFDNSKDRKRADLRINDKTVFMDVNAGVFEKDITPAIVEGENFIKIFAKNEFTIVQLEILLKEK